MSGHSKWATIKRKKGANDAARSKMWGKLLRFVEVAAREGGEVGQEPFLLRCQIVAAVGRAFMARQLVNSASVRP